MQRKINFNAGPAAFPQEVLEEAAEALRAYGDTGLSLIELPHRGKHFRGILDESEELVRDLCGLNSEYEVLWLQGGGRMLFCMVPMNFLPANGTAGYIDSGKWAAEALEYAMHYGDVHITATARPDNYNRLPEWPYEVPQQLAYLHYTTNNTICGTQFHSVPNVGVPLIADMSSDIFSMKRDYGSHAMFYAAAQKNLGASGVALVAVRKDMLARIEHTLPPMLDLRAHAKERSVLNTANIFGVYTSLLMLRWIKKKGIEAIEAENRQKAAILYDALDKSTLFRPHVQLEKDRSLMNVCFNADSAATEQSFLDLCEANNITGIKGHRSFGGFRVSLYNAVSLQAVEMLTDVMREFERKR